MQANGLARIGLDAELRSTPSGESVINLALAFSYGRKGEDGKKPTQWVNGSLWGKRAESLAQYLVKGQLVYVVMEDVFVRTYQKDGKEGHALEGRITAIEFAGSQPSQEQAARVQPKPRQEPAKQPDTVPKSFIDDFDDDIPF